MQSHHAPVLVLPESQPHGTETAPAQPAQSHKKLVYSIGREAVGFLSPYSSTAPEADPTQEPQYKELYAKLSEQRRRQYDSGMMQLRTRLGHIAAGLPEEYAGIHMDREVWRDFFGNISLSALAKLEMIEKGQMDFRNNVIDIATIQAEAPAVEAAAPVSFPNTDAWHHVPTLQAS